MKKLSILSALLLSVAVIFMSCKTPVNPEDDDKVDQTVERVTLSDGIWNAKILQKVYSNPVTMDYEICGKFSSVNNVGTAQSGTMNISMNTAEVMGSNYTTYTQMTAEQKETYKTAFLNQLKASLAQVTTSFGVLRNATMDDSSIKLEIELGSSYLSQFNTMLNFNNTNWGTGTVIKTNKKKTKYEITVPQTQGEPITYIFTKD